MFGGSFSIENLLVDLLKFPVSRNWVDQQTTCSGKKRVYAACIYCVGFNFPSLVAPLASIKRDNCMGPIVYKYIIKIIPGNSMDQLIKGQDDR